MQARLEAKIAGFGCMSPSIICGCRRWPSAKAHSEISEPNPYRARNRKFESISLHRRVCELLVPKRRSRPRPDATPRNLTSVLSGNAAHSEVDRCERIFGDDHE